MFQSPAVWCLGFIKFRITLSVGKNDQIQRHQGFTGFHEAGEYRFNQKPASKLLKNATGPSSISRHGEHLPAIAPSNANPRHRLLVQVSKNGTGSGTGKTSQIACKHWLGTVVRVFTPARPVAWSDAFLGSHYHVFPLWPTVKVSKTF
jgi:hypothetical protein